MSKFIGRRFIGGGGGDGYSDHGQLSGLLDDDHPQYLITTAIRTLVSPSSGLEKTGTTAGSVFSLINAGTGPALFIQQTGTTDAYAAAYIDNTENDGSGLSVVSANVDPSQPLVTFSVSSSTFDEPILLLTHPDQHGLALEVFGDGYLSGHLYGTEAVRFVTAESNPIPLGEPGIYIKKTSPTSPGEFYFVDKDGNERTWTEAVAAGILGINEGCHINTSETDGYVTVSVDLNTIAGTGLRIEEIDGYCDRLAVDFVGQIYSIHKLGYQADDPDYRSIFSLDGYTYPLDEDRLMVYINGVTQFSPRNYIESSTSTITFTTPVDPDDEIDILILPGSLGGGNGGTTTLQNAYDNSLSGVKTIFLDDGQITFAQTLSTGSVLRLISGNVTTALSIDQSGSGEAARLKTVHGTNPTLLLQKDTVSRNTIVDTFVIERTTSHVIGSQTGIGSSILTRLEDTGGNLFPASRITTGTEDATDSSEKTYMSFELSNDGIFEEHIRLTSIGRFGIGTILPSKTIHVEGDGYLSQDLEVANKVIAGSNTGRAPINVPIFTVDPGDLSNGDVWVTDIGGTREIKVRIGGTTYSAVLT